MHKLLLLLLAATGLLSGCGQEVTSSQSSVDDFLDSTNVSLLLRFRESAGAQTFVDSSGTSNHATCNGTTIPCPSAGEMSELGPAIRLTAASTQFLQVADSATLDNTNKLTVEFWAYPKTSDGTARAVISKRTGTNANQSFSVFLLSSKVQTDIDGNGDRFSCLANIVANRWYHVVLTYDGALANPRARLFINGQLDRTANETSITIPNYASNLTVGTLHNGDGRYFDGFIHEVAVYLRTMTREEIQSRYLRLASRAGHDVWARMGLPGFSQDVDCLSLFCLARLFRAKNA